MKIFTLLFFCVCSLLSVSSSWSIDKTAIEKAEASVVRVVSLDNRDRILSLGSGFAIARGKYIVTNFHVVDGGRKFIILIRGPDNEPRKIDGYLKWSSTDLDLAFVGIPSSNLEGLSISISSLTKGEEIFALGYPGAADLSLEAIEPSGIIEATLTTGSIGRLVKGKWEKDGSPIEIIQHSASINSGNSGGPLLDTCRRVVGVNTAKAASSLEENQVDATTGIHFASGAKALIEGAKEAQIDLLVDSTPCLPASNQSSISTSIKSETDIVAYFFVFLAAIAFVTFLVPILRTSPRFSDKFRASIENSGKERDLANHLREPGSAIYLLEGHNSDGERVTISLEPLNGVVKALYLGRAEEMSQLIVSDKTVSRRHLKIELIEDRFWIQDCDSKNGSFVNGVRLAKTRTLVRVGDELTIGSVRLKLSRGAK